MQYTHITIENFCGISSFDSDLYSKTLISGKNGVGKSTIRNAILWVLTDKLSDGSKADNIRPHDIVGMDQDFIDIMVALTVKTDDGREIVLKKTQKQKWVKKRGSESEKYEGNANEFSVNDIPKKEKDYKEYITALFSEDALMYGTNATTFLNLDMKKRREKLLSLEPDFNDDKVIACDARFGAISEMLKDGTIEELISRSKKAISVKNEALKTIPCRIDELEKQRVTVDVTDLEKQKKDFENLILEKNAEIEQFNAFYDGMTKGINIKIDSVKAEIEEAKNNSAKGVVEERERLTGLKFDASANKYHLENDIAKISNEISRLTDSVKTADAERAELGKEYNAVKDSIFDEKPYIYDEKMGVCPTCNRPLDAGKIEEIKNSLIQKKNDALAKFNSDKEESLNALITKANKIKADTNRQKALITGYSDELTNKKAELDNLNKEIAEIDSKLSENKVDAPDLTDKEQKLAEYKTELNSAIDEHKAKVNGLNITIKELKDKLYAVDLELSRNNNDALDSRIEQLKEEQRNTSQAIADEEQLLDVLSLFNRTKISMITNAVNKHFNAVKFVMFREQINGGFEAVCEPTIKGTSYYGLLNHGNKILAEIDICKAFQNVNGVSIPIIIDDTESLDQDKIPAIDNQLIVIRRTDNEELKIGELQQ